MYFQMNFKTCSKTYFVQKRF